MNSNPIIKVTAAILEWNGQILIAQRGAGDPLAGKWEFPGGKIEPGETPEACLQREIKEELAIEVAVGEPLGTSRHDQPDAVIELIAFRTTWVAGNIHAGEHAAYRWVSPGELAQYDFAPADLPFVNRLISAAI